MRKYLTSYRGIEYASPRKSQAELLFHRKMKGKLSDLAKDHVTVEVRDRDTEQKGKAKTYADAKRGEGHGTRT